MNEELKILQGDYIIEILIKYIQLNIESVIAIDVIYFCSERTTSTRRETSALGSHYFIF